MVLNFRNKERLIYIVFLSAVLPLMALGLPAVEKGRSYNMETLSCPDGLSSSRVFAMAQDSTGYMWFGTDNGLNRYDGKTFRRYNNSDANPNRHDLYINCLYVSMKGELLIGTEKGLNVYIPKKDRVMLYPVPEALQNQNIRTLAEEGAILWIGTNKGLFRMDRSTGKLTCYNTSNSGLANNVVRAIHFDEDYMFIGTFDGISRLGRRDGTWKSVNMKPHYFRQPLNNLVLSIIQSCFDPNILFVGTQTGLSELDKVTMKFRLHEKSFERKMVNNTVKTMCVVAGELWLGTEEGVMIYDGKSFRSLGYDPGNVHSLPNNIIWSILKDRGDIVWMATEAGVAKYDAAIPDFENVDFTQARGNPYVGISVFAASLDSRHRLWLGSRFGLSVYTPATTEMRWIDLSNKVEGTYNFVQDLCLDSNGLLWMGTAEGVMCYDTEHNTEIAVQAMLKNRLKYIYAVVQDKQGRICLGDHLGYMQVISYQFDPVCQHFVSLEDHLFQLGEQIESMVLDGDFVWGGTRSNGIVRYDRITGEVKRYGQGTDSVSSHMIYCLYMNRKTGELWAGTDKGLDKYDPAADRFFRMSSDDIQGGVYTICSDNSGLLWFSMSQNLVCYDILSGIFKKFPLWHWFDRNNATLSTSLCGNGDIYIFGLDRYLKLNKSNIRQKRTRAPLCITDLRVVNEPIACMNITDLPVEDIRHLRLTHNQNMLTFCFSMLDYSAPSITTYNYRLYGYDVQWKTVSGATPYVEYAKLSPGRYVLQVNATSSEGIKASNNIILNIRILPPLWGSWWALIVYVLFASGVVFYIWSVVSKRHQMVAEFQQEKLKHEKIEEVNQMKLRFFTNISHDFRTPLSLIVSPVETLIDEEHDAAKLGKLNLIRDNALRLLRLINQILDFRNVENMKMVLKSSQGDFIKTMRNIYWSFTELAARKSISLFFETSVEHLVMDYDHDKVDKIFVNILSNAMKFTPDKGHVMINVSRVNTGKIEVVVADTGIGIPDNGLQCIFERFYQVEEHVTVGKGSGIGLTIVKEFVELLGGSIRVMSNLGEGTTFIVTLPILNEEVAPCPAESGTEAVLYFGGKPSSPMEGQREFLILLVEDDCDMRNYLNAELAKHYDIIAIPDAENALKVMDERIPDLVISDIMLPGMSGLDFCRKIKCDFLTNHIPVILLTAKSDEENVIEGFEVGSDEYIIKPFNLKILITRIDNIIHQRTTFRKSLLRDTIELRPIDKQSPDEEFIRRVVMFIEENITNPELNIPFLCDKLSMTHINFYRKVKSITGMNVNSFVRELRLKKAAQLLRIKGVTISDAMYEVGFNHRSYFSMCFREMFGTTPKAYAHSYNNTEANEE